MAEVLSFEAGGFRFIKGVFQYSAGVAAQPGFEIERVRFLKPLPLQQGFAAVERHLNSIGRPLQAFCACELRSPEPFTEAGFASFNKQYVGTLEKWGLMQNGLNPVARTNVCPEIDKPEQSSIYAFSYTVLADGSRPASFVGAGSGEAPEGMASYRDHAIRLGDRTADGLQEKARWVLGEMERRMAALGFDWNGATRAHLYTVYDIHPFLEAELARRGAMRSGLTWHYARPPVQDLDYEMDVQGVYRESVLAI